MQGEKERKHSEQLLNSPAKSRKGSRAVVMERNNIGFNCIIFILKIGENLREKNQSFWKVRPSFPHENFGRESHHNHIYKIKNERRVNPFCIFGGKF